MVRRAPSLGSALPPTTVRAGSWFAGVAGQERGMRYAVTNQS